MPVTSENIVFVKARKLTTKILLGRHKMENVNKFSVHFETDSCQMLVCWTAILKSGF